MEGDLVMVEWGGRAVRSLPPLLQVPMGQCGNVTYQTVQRGPQSDLRSSLGKVFSVACRPVGGWWCVGGGGVSRSSPTRVVPFPGLVAKCTVRKVLPRRTSSSDVAGHDYSYLGYFCFQLSYQRSNCRSDHLYHPIDPLFIVI